MAHQVEVRNSICLFDLNIAAEDFYKELLNIVYSLNFVNLNNGNRNAKAIDLGDRTARKAIQVTSDNSSGKIKDTITKFVEAERHIAYDELTILMLKRKKAYKNIPMPAKFGLAVKDHLDLMRDINGQPSAQLKRILEFLDNELVKHSQDRGKADADILKTFADDASRYIAQVAEHIVETRGGENPGHDLDNHELLDKFEKMKCSATYKKKFERCAVFFPAVTGVITTDAVAGGAATIRAIIGLIQNIYVEVLSQSINGDAVHNQIMQPLLHGRQYSPEETIAAEVLIFFTINECGIFNETK